MRMPMLIPLLLMGIVTSVAVRHHHLRIKHGKHSASHHGNFHQIDSAHTVQSHSASLDALSLVGDALHHATNNKLAALPRFKSKAPYDPVGSKTIKKPSAGTDGGDAGNSDPPSVFKVVPEAKTGLKMHPMPGMKDPTVYVRAPGKYDTAANVTSGYVQESQLTAIDKIKDAIDASENRIKGLKLRVVEKQNFLDSLRKRERILDADVSQDQGAIRNLLNHIDALDMRLTRIKKEDELKQLSAMYDNFTSKAVNLEGQAAGLTSARDALFNRIQWMHNTIGGLRQREDEDARMAVGDGDETLQAYGYSGALRDRKESLQDEMAQQMQHMALQQQLLQQQLAFVTGNKSSSATKTTATGGAKKKSGAATPPAATTPPAKK